MPFFILYRYILRQTATFVIDIKGVYMANIYYKNNGTFQQITYADVGAAAANHTHETTTGTIAINNSPVNGSNTYLYWARYGNVVSGYFSCKLSAAISAWSYARLGSSGSLPAPASGISMYWPIMLDGNGSTQAAFNLGSNGVPYIHMRGGTGASGNVFHGSFCYVCVET